MKLDYNANLDLSTLESSSENELKSLYESCIDHQDNKICQENLRKIKGVIIIKALEQQL